MSCRRAELDSREHFCLKKHFKENFATENRRLLLTKILTYFNLEYVKIFWQHGKIPFSPLCNVFQKNHFWLKGIDFANYFNFCGKPQRLFKFLKLTLLGSKLGQWSKSIIGFTNGEEKIGVCPHLFTFLSVTWTPSPLSPAVQLLLGSGTGVTGNFFAGSRACGLTFCNYPLLHLLMGYLTCLVENLHLSGVSDLLQTACWSFW